MAVLPLSDQLSIFRSANAAFGLFSLDSIWTLHLQNSKRINAGDLGTLRLLTDALQALIVEAEQAAVRTLNVFERNHVAINDAYAQRRPRLELTPKGTDWLNRKLMRAGDLGNLGSASSRFIIKTGSRERQQLRAKMALIDAGKFSEGDLSKTFLCSLASNAFVGGLAATMLTANPMGLVIAAAGAGFAAGADC